MSDAVAMSVERAREVLLERLALVGTCNRCGSCCQEYVHGEWHTCAHLVLEGVMGQPSATTCGVYDARRDGMAIELLAPSGASYVSRCWKDSPNETRGILRSGLGRGCTLMPGVSP